MSDLVRKSGNPDVIKKSKSSDSYTFVISSEEPDLVGDVVVQKGLKPVSDRIPAQIDHSGKVADLAGSWANIRLDSTGKQTLADFIPFQKGISQTADLVRALLDSGVRMAASIGFKGQGEFRDPKKGYSGGMIYKSASLLETSIVVVPCHQQALSVAKSLNIPKSVVDSILEKSDNDQEETDPEVLSDLADL